MSEAYWYPCNVTVETMNCKRKLPVHIESYFLRIVFSEIELQWVKYILLKSTNTGLTSELLGCTFITFSKRRCLVLMKHCSSSLTGSVTERAA